MHAEVFIGSIGAQLQATKRFVRTMNSALRNTEMRAYVAEGLGTKQNNQNATKKGKKAVSLMRV